MRLWTLLASFLINFALLFTACSDHDKNAGGTSEAENSIAITDKEVAGVSQKGPFTKGSNVTLYELNFRTRAQTGKSFIGKISDSTGSFSINKIELASQYALLQAEGYYLNEITGKVSASQIALNAISDLSERDNVNINLLTHLEYERAIWLANENETTIKNAKVEADKEIFSAFGVEYTGDRFEDLDIFGKDDADAALLAISVIMHSGRSEGEFSLALANMAMDLEKDGKWDDAKAIAEAADNSFEADTVQIRKNMEAWNIAKTIPDFAPTVEYFWNDAFGLGRCTAKREGETKQDSNSRSRYYQKKFICEKTHWHLVEEKSPSSSSISDESSSSSAADKKNSSSSTKRSSSSRQSSATIDSPYREETSIIDPEVLAILGTCNSDNEGAVKKAFNVSFICRSGLWYSLLLADMEQDSWFNPNITYGTLTDERDGQTYRTVVIGTQNWMAENLHYAGDNASEELVTNMAGEDLCPSGDEECCEKTGYIYSWTAAMNISPMYQTRVVATIPIDAVHQGICPEGWHMPTQEEWDILFDYVKSTYGEDEQITALKSFETWIWYDKEHIPSNKTGFSAIANGEYPYNYSFDWMGGNTSFFSATYNNPQTTSHNEEDFKYNELERGIAPQSHDHKAYVRCVENAAP
jgi:uncharacterized protein (TIGR02145 family)